MVKNMNYMTTKEAVVKWNISERRIRQLLAEGRIEGAVKVGSSWNIPIDAVKPVDKRIIKPDDNYFIIDLEDNYFDEVDSLKKELDSKRPIKVLNRWNFYAMYKRQSKKRQRKL